VDYDSRTPLFDPQHDASEALSSSRLAGIPVEAVGDCQRIVVNPLVAIVCCMSGVALVQHALRTRNLILFCSALGVLFLSLLLIQFHCRDCGTTGWYLHASKHACNMVVSRWRQNLSATGLRARTQLLIWTYVVAFGVLGYLVFALARM
jgi:hypothetical protein